MDIEIDVEGFEGRVDQAGQDQHEQAVQQLAPNWFHLFLSGLRLFFFRFLALTAGNDQRCCRIKLEQGGVRRKSKFIPSMRKIAELSVDAVRVEYLRSPKRGNQSACNLAAILGPRERQRARTEEWQRISSEATRARSER